MRHANSHGNTGSFDEPRSAWEADVAAHVGAALRAEAQRHTPDSVAMLARVRRDMLDGDQPGMARQHGHRGLALTPARVAVAACAAIAVAGGGWVLADHPAARPSPASRLADSVPRSASPTPASTAGVGGAVNARSATPTSPPETASPSASASASSSATHGASAPATQVRQGFLSSAVSVNKSSGSYWSQDELMLTSTKTISSLTVVLRLASTPGLTNSGSWSSNSGITITVTPQDGMLVYTFALSSGATLPAGTYQFAAQYSYASGTRDTGQDTYTASASAGATEVRVYGNFGS